MARRLTAALAAAATLTASFALAAAGDQAGDKTGKAKTPAAPPSASDLPPGMDPADMQAYMEAGTPGPMHAHLMKSVGTWEGKTSSWPAPDAPAMTGTCTSTVSALMDGKFIQTEVKGEFPGMGPFNGLGINGYDNVSRTFQSTWIDNMGTGMMQGTGKLSEDGKTLTWSMNFYCPITKKACVMREVDTFPDANTMKLEMFGPHPKTGKEFKMMEIVFTRTGDANKATAAVSKN